jgi:iron-only hydrogenase group A
MNKVKIQIDDINIEVPENSTIMEACDKIGIHIPRLCYHPILSNEGACRICIVEVDGIYNYLPSCSTKVFDGMKIKTNSPEIRQARRDLVELMLDNHPMDCQLCIRNGNCELQSLSYKLGVRERLFEGVRKSYELDLSSDSVVRNAEKCILCGQCIRVCAQIQGVYNLSQHHRGVNTVVTPAFLSTMEDSVCVKCGQCINVCPTAAFTEKDYTEKIWAALNDPNMFVVAQTAPSIRAAIAEGFGSPPGVNGTGQMITALRRLGFDAVFDTNFGADLTIVEESVEFLKRLESGRNLPMITSCSPGWIKFLEHFYPELIPNASTCKSPMQMVSTLLKTYYAEKNNIDPKRIFVVGVMPCTAKKFESRRPEHYSVEGGFPYTDAVITTRELIWMIKAYGIDFNHLPKGNFDLPLGFSTGAGDIFGATGGVMEATLRTCQAKLTGTQSQELEYFDVRDVEGLREASVKIGDRVFNIAIANGLNNAKTILNKVVNKEKEYHILEIMACMGGCVAGGGQPIPYVGEFIYPLDKNMIKLRAKALYDIDENKSIRRAHENPYIEKLYEDYLGTPGGELAYKLLHTHYHPRLPKGI